MEIDKLLDSVNDELKEKIAIGALDNIIGYFYKNKTEDIQYKTICAIINDQINYYKK